nr:immunoglobulin light chain junction region [Macaca mulatta]MOW54473.1 immunoglobulin light chain junction region [Macaca mulatta]MOW55331.1 immunoglobulin light chain junction region [Macaca mulatta]MOW55779.1 immunoglobulin light chain junction region [Macaca mulatta]
CMQSLDFPRTF